MILSYLLILAIFAIFSILIFSIIKAYFNYKQKIQNNNHYLVALAITLLAIPFFAGFFSLDIYPIMLINKLSDFNLPLPDNNFKMMFYGMYILAVIIIILIYYKFQKNSKEFIKVKSAHFEISYPSNEIILSPFFYERIKELFELKYEKQNLKLLYDEKEQVLVGEYSDAIHEYRYIIYCNHLENEVSKNNQNTVLSKLKKIHNQKNLSNSDKYEAKYFYFIQDGVFENNENNELKCYDENIFLNIIIDFSTYLKKNINLFEKKLSNIGGVSFSESFISPKFNDGNSNLEQYLDEWLSEKSYRHISLLADYGMGKTTFSKYYTSYLSKKILSGESFSRYPVFISLTNTSPMSNDGIETKIQSFVSKELGVNYALFERLVHLGKIVFILDGFDEMGFIGTDKTRFEQFNSIWQLATKDNKILISGRPSYLPTEFERNNVLNIVDKGLEISQQNPFTEVIELDYFQEKDIYKTLKIYYKDNKTVKQYMKYVKDNQSVFDLCKRPSMLHMTMSILPSLYEEGSKKNISATALMNKYIEFWISRQERKNITGYFKKNDNRKKDFLINFFTQLASKMYEERTLLVSKTKLDYLINQEIEKINLNQEFKEETFEGLKNEIYSGYFIEVDINYSKEDNFKFVHKSIFEFFVSKKIINLINDKDFNHPLWTTSWDKEIIDFIDSEIDVKNNSKYPTLILLRNNILDKLLFIPITNITASDIFKFLLSFLMIIYTFSFILSLKEPNNSFNLNEFLLSFIVVVFLIVLLKISNSILDKRLDFISKAYFIGIFKNNHITKSRQLQHFLDFHELFKKFTNITLNKFTFNKNLFSLVYFKDSLLKEVVFDKCKMNTIHFNNTQFNNVNFKECEIKYLRFDNCAFNNVNFATANFKDDTLTRQFLLQFILINRFIISKILRSNRKSTEIYRAYVRKIIFSNIDIHNFDDKSIDSFKSFIRNYNIQRKDILCNKELKNLLFSN